MTLFCIAVGAAVALCGGPCAMPDGHCLNILLFCWRSTAALVFGLAPVSRFHSSVPFSHSSPSLIGLLASVDVLKQQLLSLLSLSVRAQALYELYERSQELCESRGGRPGLPSLINLRFLWM